MDKFSRIRKLFPIPPMFRLRATPLAPSKTGNSFKVRKNAVSDSFLTYAYLKLFVLID